MATVAQSHAVQVSCPIVATRVLHLAGEQSSALSRDRPAVDPGYRPRCHRDQETSSWNCTLSSLAWTPAIGSPDIEDAFRLFVEVRNRHSRTAGTRFPGNFTCFWQQDHRYLDELGDGVLTFNQWGWSRLNGDRARQLMPARMDDPNHVARAWVVTLAYLLTDYRYLHF